GEDTARAVVFGAVRWGFGRSAERIAEVFHEDPHAPPALTDAEMAKLRTATLDGAPAWVAGDYPEWLDASMARIFADARAKEGAALAKPAPLDLRTNTLKTTREKLIDALGRSARLLGPPSPTTYAPDGVRIPWSQGRSFPWASEQAFIKGWYEVQDE